MQNKPVALITGASRGIGRATAIALAKSGMAVALCARSHAGLKETDELCGGETLLIEGDLSHPSFRKEVIDKTLAHFKRLDVLVNNAGIHEVESLESWHETLQVNLVALMDLTYFALPHLEKSKEAAVINIASIAGLSGMANSMAYCASKHGVMGFTRALFEEIREKGIKVSAICPGYVSTDIVTTPGLKHDLMIQPEDIAKAVLFIAQFPTTGCPTEIVIRPQRSPR